MIHLGSTAVMLTLVTILASSTSALALQSQSSLRLSPSFAVSQNADESSTSQVSNDSECIPGGQALFLHIMKTGGSSVDDFVSCHCERVGCGLYIKEDINFEPIVRGKKDCEPSICSTHGSYSDRVKLCGSSFEKVPKVFTILRDPIDRVVSFYTYSKKIGKKLPPSIKEVYEACDNNLAGFEESEWVNLRNACFQMTNLMVRGIFSKEDSYGNFWKHPSALQDYNSTSLQHAKRFVNGLNAIFFYDELKDFPSAFKESNLISNEYLHPEDAECPLHNYVRTKHSYTPTQEEYEMIEKHNEMDIDLYAFASKKKRSEPHATRMKA